ncbi:conserved hypothetical protein [Ricinus communis]|uniref:Protein kinase domain-containing protein n=1 Tax=Ricinus communis TaxID=3988 RepID=B9RFM5_RICCO|nr:conserved hypothetical protein [Ricinus communis]
MLAIPIVSAALTVVVIVLLGSLWLRKKRKTKVKRKSLFSIWDESELAENRQTTDVQNFNLRTISAATNNFNPSNKLGRGGFSSVCKGQLPDEQEIAVKRLSRSSLQGKAEFKSEAMLIAKLQRRNLIIQEDWLLIGENAKWLYGAGICSVWKVFSKIRCFQFWSILLEIISGRKRNTCYPNDLSLNLIGHVSNRNGFNKKAWKCQADPFVYYRFGTYGKKTVSEIVDPSLRDSSSLHTQELYRCIQIGLLCVQKNAKCYFDVEWGNNSSKSKTTCIHFGKKQHSSKSITWRRNTLFCK